MTRLIAVALSLSLPVFAQPATSIAPPPPGSWVVDRAGVLDSSALQELNAIAREVNGQGLGQIGVLVVRSTGGVSPRTYALQVFNHWGIGNAERDDGVLLFAAIDDRKAEILLGDGVDGANEQRRSDEVMQSAVVANFKRGDPSAAMLEGVRGLRGLLTDARINSAEKPEVPVALRFSLERPRGAWVIDVDDQLSPALERVLNELSWQEEAEGRPALLFVAYDGLARSIPTHQVASWAPDDVLRLDGDAWLVILSTTARDALVVANGTIESDEQRADLEILRQDFKDALWEPLDAADDEAARESALYGAAERAREFAQTGDYPRSIGEMVGTATSRHGGKLGFGLAGFSVFGFLGLRRWLRYRPRDCDACGTPRELLADTGDDPHLTAGQQREEQLKSVDYDVWWCGRCRDALTLRNKAFFSGYASCPQCAHVTRKQTSTTLVSATYDHGGVVQVVENCGYCSYHRTYQRHTARLTRSSSSSSSSRSSSSFGGGSSSGRGSSGSW